jgi:hypothetical protein
MDREVDDLRWMEALMKSIWGTDTRCEQPAERAAADAMLDRAERRVERLQAHLDQPHRNLDEALRDMTRSDQ